MPRSVAQNSSSAGRPDSVSCGELGAGGRWIRPALPAAPRPGAADAERSGAALYREARRRISGLAALERSLEERIRRRWRQVEEDDAQRRADLERELRSIRENAEREVAEARARGRAAGYQQGFERGHAEGHRIGLADGRRSGLEAGAEEGRREATRRVEGELGHAAASLAAALESFRRRREALLSAVRSDVLRLAVEIARKLVKRELDASADVVLHNVEKALELILRRGNVVILVNELDVATVGKALEGSPAWTRGFAEIAVRAAVDVERGGCRLVAAAGTVDMTLPTQIELIEEALGLRAEDASGGHEDGDTELVTEPGADTEESGA